MYLSSLFLSSFDVVQTHQTSVIWFADGIPFASPKEGQIVEVLFRDPLVIRLQLFSNSWGDRVIDLMEIYLREPITSNQANELIGIYREYFRELDQGYWDDEHANESYQRIIESVPSFLGSSNFACIPEGRSLSFSEDGEQRQYRRWDEPEDLMNTLNESDFRFCFLVGSPKRIVIFPIYRRNGPIQYENIGNFDDEYLYFAHKYLIEYLQECEYFLQSE